MEPGTGGEHQEILEEPSAGAEAPSGRVDVDRVLDGRGVGRTVSVGTEGGEPHHSLASRSGVAGGGIVVDDGHDGLVRALVSGDPVELLLEGPGDQVEGHGRAGHLRVVDREEGRGIVELDGAGAHDLEA